MRAKRHYTACMVYEVAQANSPIYNTVLLMGYGGDAVLCGNPIEAPEGDNERLGYTSNGERDAQINRDAFAWRRHWK